MSALPFTDRELRNAWNALRLASGVSPRTPPANLLLFYAIECGLKYVWLRQENKLLFDADAIECYGHDLNKLISELRIGQDFSLPMNIRLEDVRTSYIGSSLLPRNGGIDALHQAWRYGGKVKHPLSVDIEQRMEQLVQWIEKQMQ